VNRDVAELEERFQLLNRSRSALSAEMRASAAELRDAGVVPSEALDRSLVDYRELFGRLRAELGITSHDAFPETGSSWDMFQGRLNVIRQAADATQRLHAVARLSVPSGHESVLEPVRQAWGDATHRIAKSPWDEADLIQEVREGRHMLCRLVSLVERLNALTDDEWTHEMAAVQHSYGVPLSTAIARGKVILSDSGSENRN
jgi:hypothetical protein